MTGRLTRYSGIVALLLASAAPVCAADLPPLNKAPVYKAPVAAPAYDWTGLYAGVNLGYGVARNPTNMFEGLFGGGESVALQPAGVLGGVQLGYNWQFAPHWVAGIEADFQGTGQSSSDCLMRCLPVAAEIVEQKMPWFGTVRGRLGWASGPMLVYATGGVAYGREETTATIIDPPTPSISPQFAHTRTGWVAGAGIEGAIAANWTAKAEYLHIDLGSATDAFNFGPFITFANTQYFRDNVFRLGVNYHLGAPQTYAAVGMPDRIAPYAWSGFYVGVNAGYGVARNPTSYVATGFQPEGDTFNLDPAGWLGGAQAGINWQSGQWVFGLEADIQGQSANTSPICVTVCGPGVGVSISQSLPWFGTARGRFGWANGPVLFYATGGLAYGEVDTTVNNANTAFVPPFVIANGINLSSTRIGWTAGGGIEGQVAGNWTAKAEYLYLSLGGQSGSFSSDFGLGFTQASTITTDVREHIFRLGLNYKLF